jgi:hypothetical protein
VIASNATVAELPDAATCLVLTQNQPGVLINLLKGGAVFTRLHEVMQLADYVGRILFPQQDRWERRRNVKVLFTTLSVLLVAVLVGLIFIHKRLQQNELNPEPQMIIQPALPS